MKLCGAASSVEDVIDRRTGMRGIDNFEPFMKFLAPIERGPIDEAVARAKQSSRKIGCASCHIPQLRYRRKPESAIRSKAREPVLRSAAARRRHRRRDRAGRCRSGRDPNAGTLGASFPPAAAARRKRCDSRKRRYAVMETRPRQPHELLNHFPARNSANCSPFCSPCSSRTSNRRASNGPQSLRLKLMQ